MGCSKTGPSGWANTHGGRCSPAKQAQRRLGVHQTKKQIAPSSLLVYFATEWDTRSSSSISVVPTSNLVQAERIVEQIGFRAVTATRCVINNLSKYTHLRCR